MNFPYSAKLVKRMGDLDSHFAYTDLYGYKDNENIGDMIKIDLGDVVLIHAHFNSTKEVTGLTQMHKYFADFLNKNSPIAAFAIEGVDKLWYTPLSLFQEGKHKCNCYPGEVWKLAAYGCKCNGE